RQESVSMGHRALHQTGVAPELWRDARHQAASEAGLMVAGARPVLPEDMRRTKKPVLVQSVQRDRGPAPRNDGRPADERNIVEMHDVERAGEDGAFCSRLYPGMTGLLCDQR